MYDVIKTFLKFFWSNISAKVLGGSLSGIMIVKIRRVNFLERENHFDFSENDKMCEMGRNLRFRLIPNTLYIIILLFHRIIGRVRKLRQTKFSEVWYSGTKVENSVPNIIHKNFLLRMNITIIY